MLKLKRQTLTWLTLAAASLATACGGMEPLPGEGGQSHSLMAAPMAVLELDLPGCDCEPQALASDAVTVQADDTILRHPTDGSLRVAVRDGVFLCVGPRMNMLLNADTSPQGPASGGGGSSVQAGPGGSDGSGGLRSDDPIPIINEFQGTVTENSDSH